MATSTLDEFIDDVWRRIARCTRIHPHHLRDELPLSDHWDHGPLFAPENKQRPLARPHGKEGAIRRAQERFRTPAWADRAAIRAIYAEARRLTRETGELHVVDHIVPLIGKQNGIHIVDGLHWEGNMQVVHWKPNNQKGNFWWPDMPFEQLELL